MSARTLLRSSSLELREAMAAVAQHIDDDDLKPKPEDDLDAEKGEPLDPEMSAAMDGWLEALLDSTSDDVKAETEAGLGAPGRRGACARERVPEP